MNLKEDDFRTFGSTIYEEYFVIWAHYKKQTYQVRSYYWGEPLTEGPY